MEELLQTSLQENEEILWRGKPEPFETLDKTHKRKFITDVVIGLLITILITVVYVLVGRHTGVSVKPLILLVILILCGIPAFNILGDASKLRKTEYIATNQRLIVLRDTDRSMEYGAIHEAEFRKDSDGHISLVCGSDALSAKESKWREICTIGQTASE